jgi:hypothetical protein
LEVLFEGQVGGAFSFAAAVVVSFAAAVVVVVIRDGPSWKAGW